MASLKEGSFLLDKVFLSGSENGKEHKGNNTLYHTVVMICPATDYSDKRQRTKTTPRCRSSAPSWQDKYSSQKSWYYVKFLFKPKVPFQCTQLINTTFTGLSTDSKVFQDLNDACTFWSKFVLKSFQIYFQVCGDPIFWEGKSCGTGRDVYDRCTGKSPGKPFVKSSFLSTICGYNVPSTR